jgi:hypothetical protein
MMLLPAALGQPQVPYRVAANCLNGVAPEHLDALPVPGADAAGDEDDPGGTRGDFLPWPTCP